MKQVLFILFSFIINFSKADVEWDYTFVNVSEIAEEDVPILNLIHEIATLYLDNCMVILLYDDTFASDLYLVQVVSRLLETFPFPLMHGVIDTTGSSRVNPGMLYPAEANKCAHYVAFTRQLEMIGELLAERRDSRIVLITTTSKWMVREYLSSVSAKRVPNLLIVSDPLLQKESFLSLDEEEVSKDINLYTHKFYVNGLGASAPMILTTWRDNKFTRPEVDLFPMKFEDGFNGHRLAIAVKEQPPFVFLKKEVGADKNGDTSEQWDGLEVRIIKQMARMLNFTIEFRSIPDSNEGDGVAGKVINEVKSGKVEIGLAGLYITDDRIDDVIFSPPHSQDCASFVTLTSTAVDRYRAVFGPFTGGVWIAMTMVYIFGIVPLSFSDNHTLSHLKSPKEWENMFWFVFGTFTNCFTFRGAHSWTSSQKIACRTFIAAYWVFTIIMTSAYTGSIIAFITLPATPEMVDSSKELMDKDFRISLLNEGGWQYWLTDLADSIGQKLLEKPIMVPDIESGLKNVTRSNYLHRYAFLGSFNLIEWYLRTNLTGKKATKAKFHLSSECFVPYMVGMAYSNRAMFVYEMNEALLRASQAGYIAKFERDLEWEYYRKAASKLVQAAAAHLVPEDRSLTIDDVQGVFILMGFGCILGQIIFFSECFCAYKEGRYDKKGALSTGSSVDPLFSDDSDEKRGPSIVVSSYEDCNFDPQNYASDPSYLQCKISASMMALQPHLMDAINIRRKSN